MEHTVGEYKCGRNTLDHEDVVDFWFPHTSASINFKIEVSDHGFAWGVKEIIMHVMKCDSSCATCDGPTEFDCLTCSSNLEEVVDGDCVCDIGQGYYNESGTCVNKCSSTAQYLNPETRTCTTGCPDFPS